MSEKNVGFWFITACVSCAIAGLTGIVTLFTTLTIRSLIVEQNDLNTPSPVQIAQPCSKTETVSLFGLSKTRTETGDCEK